MSTPTNRLNEATSPYLQQHAENPVEWYPWGDEALSKARRENKPILLSIGYSACHWCHVMAHESFEDPKIAAVMNRHFINIKVDREERPDLDKIYQTAHQLLIRRPGGWPLTMFLTAQERLPFYGGTYFPPRPRHGLPAFPDLLEKIADYYQQHPDEIKRNGDQLLAALEQIEPKPSSGAVTFKAQPITLALQQLTQSYDTEFGGFGKAPKFPHPSNLELLLRQPADSRTEAMALNTLRAMAQGGVNDQLWGGFYRYSVDQEWMIPHFEKMLYDNGPLLCLYSDAWQKTENELFAQTAHNIADWVMREMQAPEGGYYSSLDADSEGEEGKFYVWQPDEVRRVLDEAQYAVFSRHYGLDRPYNFEGKHHHLHVFRPLSDIADELGFSPEQAASLLEQATQRLRPIREERIRPGCDDKILTSWNALMLKGMYRAGRLLEREDVLASADRAKQHLHTVLWEHGRLLATAKDGRAQLEAYLDDYAYLLDALLESLQHRWNNDDLQWAQQIADYLLSQFEDDEHGGFFFTAKNHESLIQRPKPLHDDAQPSGNAIAAQALLRLGYLLGESRYLEAAQGVLTLAWQTLQEAPASASAMLLSLEDTLQPPEIIILRGSRVDLEGWQETLKRQYRPQRLVFAIESNEQYLPEELADKKAEEGKVLAYRCQGSQCRTPVDRVDELMD